MTDPTNQKFEIAPWIRKTNKLLFDDVLLQLTYLLEEAA